jgi:cell wall-associated NlpC family hydrolase
MLDKMRISSVLVLIASLIVGCGSLKEKNSGDYAQLSLFEKRGISSESLKNKLYDQFQEWQGVRYQLGGLSKRGVDCSGFVYITYKSRLGVRLPRTTKLQSKLGKEVNQRNLKTGDLVFFKTGKATRHVGIYLENNQFLHASLSQGVTISHLDNTYWKSNYWKSVRI